jgi:hypothetical protein
MMALIGNAERDLPSRQTRLTSSGSRASISPRSVTDVGSSPRAFQRSLVIRVVRLEYHRRSAAQIYERW